MPGNKKQSATMKERYGPNVFEAMGAEGGRKAKLSGRTYYFSMPGAAKKAQAKGAAKRRRGQK